MKATERELIRLTAQIYLERLRKEQWPDTEDDVRVTESVRTVTQIVREVNGVACGLIYMGHDFSKMNASMKVECSRCGRIRDYIRPDEE